MALPDYSRIVKQAFSMGLFGKLFRKKRWVCLRCNQIYGELKVVHEVDSPANYAIDDYEDIIYQILKCPGCGKYKVTGPYPVRCTCGRDHDGVFVTDEGRYRTYCKHCGAASNGEFLRWDENGDYLDKYIELPGGGVKRVRTKIRVLPTFGKTDLWWQ